MKLTAIPFLAALASPTAALAQTPPTPSTAQRAFRFGTYALFAQGAHNRSAGIFLNPTYTRGDVGWSGEFHLREPFDADTPPLTASALRSVPGVRFYDGLTSAVDGNRSLNLRISFQTTQYLNVRVVNTERFQLLLRAAVGFNYTRGEEITSVTEPAAMCRPGNTLCQSTPAAEPTIRTTTADYERGELVGRATVRANFNVITSDKPPNDIHGHPTFPRRAHPLVVGVEPILNAVLRVYGNGSDDSFTYGLRFPVTANIALDAEEQGNSTYLSFTFRGLLMCARNSDSHNIVCAPTFDAWAGVNW